jgi:hypothetical protein
MTTNRTQITRATKAKLTEVVACYRRMRTLYDDPGTSDQCIEANGELHAMLHWHAWRETIMDVIGDEEPPVMPIRRMGGLACTQ